jgi:hypothetical protein
MKFASDPTCQAVSRIRAVKATASGDLPVTQPVDISGLYSTPAVLEAAWES